jgi:hypothetical protein
VAKKLGGAGKGQMTDAAYRAKQAELAQRKQGQQEYEAQTQKTQAGLVAGAGEITRQKERGEDVARQEKQFEAQQQEKVAGREQQGEQFQQAQQLNAAKADLEYDPETRSYKASALGAQKQKLAEQRAGTERMEVMSKVHQQEFDNHLKLKQHKLALQREGRLSEQQYLDMEEKTNAQIAKYDQARDDLMSGRTSEALRSMFPNQAGKAILSAAQKGDPKAQEMAMNKLKNRVNYLALRASSVTGAWPNLDPNSDTGAAWVEHHRDVDRQTRMQAMAYSIIGQKNPLEGMSTRMQKRFVIERAAETFLPLFAMKARMQNGAGTGSPTPGAGGVQPGGTKYGNPNPAGAAGGAIAGGAGAPGAPGAPGRAEPPRSGVDDPATGLRKGTWEQQR